MALHRADKSLLPGLGFRGGDLIKYPLCGMASAELSACVDSAKWL